MDNTENCQFNINKLENGIKFGIKVVPNSSKCEILGVIGGCVKVKLDVPPIEGKANEKLIKFLSKYFGVPKTNISIISGDTGRNKILFIKGNPEILSEKLKNFL